MRLFRLRLGGLEYRRSCRLVFRGCGRRRLSRLNFRFCDRSGNALPRPLAVLLGNLFLMNILQLLPGLIGKGVLRIELKKLLERRLRLIAVLKIAAINFPLRQQRTEAIAAPWILPAQELILPDSVMQRLFILKNTPLLRQQIGNR